MDGTFILIMLLAISPTILFILMMIWVIRYNTKRVFMYDLLSEYGGTITYQGVSFDVSKDATLNLGFGSLTIINPDGTVRRFTLGNAFSQQPIITIGGVKK